ncbi:DNA primase regulatory subunit PriL [Methanosalsum natronophilum]|uniref:DNA primase regulatory subunit PriL n=1 Tax=Methanosalsum natronophilum TaxID=768733 RepID=UPI00216A571E|nr:DNA primase regulatory subunit PriL [Methanosalsum natronophilum]MCS3923711.1 DNA primase large subunit [Methanosalsum natronophilum]
MDQTYLALYPFIPQASEHVKGLGISVDRLLESRAFESARIRGKERIIEALEGTLTKPYPETLDETSFMIELLSYPFSRILLSCIDDNYLTRRYALKEAESSSTLLSQSDSQFLIEFSTEFGINIKPVTSTLFLLHFTDYLHLSSNMKELEWKLVNRKMDYGNVSLSQRDLARLLQEAIKFKIQDSLPLELSSELCEQLEPYLKEIKAKLEERKKNFERIDTSEVDTDSFPPCVKYAISQVKSGSNLPHSMRFAMTSFLLNIGMSVDEVVNMFNISPDFDEEKTRYQIEHIAGATGNTYKPPSCNTMKTYGNCFGEDKLCTKLSHPLTYYKRKQWLTSKQDSNQSETKDESGNEDSDDGIKE